MKGRRIADAATDDATTAPATSRLTLTCAADVRPVAVEWLWPGWLPFGKLTAIVGAPGIGKSTLVTDLQARATRGGPMPGETATFAPIPVFIAGVEDGWADTIRPRLDAAGAVLTRVHFVTAPASDILTLPRDVGALGLAAAEAGARWLHLDSIMGTLGDEVNAYRDHEVRRALQPLKELAESCRMVVTFISHPRKAGGLAVNAGGGSVAFGALARVNLFAGFDPTDDAPDQNERRRVLAVGKNNLSRHATSRTFQVVPGAGGLAGCISWGATTDVSADDLTMPTESAPRPRREPRNQPRAGAEVFLEELLAGGRRLKRDEVVAAARARDLKWRTVERAALDLGVSKERAGFGGGSIWSLAESSDDSPFAPLAPLVTHIENAGANGGNGGASGANDPAPVELFNGEVAA